MPAKAKHIGRAMTRFSDTEKLELGSAVNPRAGLNHVCVMDVRISGYPDILISARGNPDVGKSGYPEIWISG